MRCNGWEIFRGRPRPRPRRRRLRVHHPPRAAAGGRAAPRVPAAEAVVPARVGWGKQMEYFKGAHPTPWEGQATGASTLRSSFIQQQGRTHLSPGLLALPHLTRVRGLLSPPQPPQRRLPLGHVFSVPEWLYEPRHVTFSFATRAGFLGTL